RKGPPQHKYSQQQQSTLLNRFSPPLAPTATTPRVSSFTTAFRLTLTLALAVLAFVPVRWRSHLCRCWLRSPDEATGGYFLVPDDLCVTFASTAAGALASGSNSYFSGKALLQDGTNVVSLYPQLRRNRRGRNGEGCQRRRDLRQEHAHRNLPNPLPHQLHKANRHDDRHHSLHRRPGQIPGRVRRPDRLRLRHGVRRSLRDQLQLGRRGRSCVALSSSTSVKANVGMDDKATIKIYSTVGCSGTPTTYGPAAATSARRAGTENKGSSSSRVRHPALLRRPSRLAHSRSALQEGCPRRLGSSARRRGNAQ
ncbi:hypothetical protein DFJ73DRAFT_903908, partial [Zopfochytrium polystomum]